MEQFLCVSGNKKVFIFQIPSAIGEWTSLTPEIENNNGFANDLGTGELVIGKKLMSKNY